MRVAVFGVGGVGGYYGARLASAGYDVSFLARGENLHALRAHGLAVESVLGDVMLPRVAAIEQSADIAPVDYVLLSVKMYDLRSALAMLSPLLAKRTAIVCVQNGIEAVDILREMHPTAHAISAVVFGSTIKISPWRIRHVGAMARMVVGGMDAHDSQRATEFATALTAANVDAAVAPDIRSVLWDKFIMFATASAACCLSRTAIGALLGDAEGKELLTNGFREAVAVAERQAISLAPDQVAKALSVIQRMDPLARPSMLLDLERGAPLELEWLSGAIVRLGRMHKVATPFHHAAYAALRPHAAGAKRPPTSA